MAICESAAGSRRRLFWATQVDACGSDAAKCGLVCGIPGLVYTANSIYNDGNSCRCCLPAVINRDCITPDTRPAQTSISTDNWVRGLIINMLMTDGKKPDTPCGYPAGTQGGHWSSSYITSGPQEIGTLVRTVKPTGLIEQQVALLGAYIDATLQRLVERGVAISVDVKSQYAGNGVVDVDITVIGTRGNDARVGIKAEKTSNGWVWN
jgi:phage gp46-like protein